MASTINISMPDSMVSFVRERSAHLGCGNTSEYFRHLVREDQKRAEEERLEALVIEGIRSGKPTPVDEAWLQERRARLAARLKRRKTA